MSARHIATVQHTRAARRLYRHEQRPRHRSSRISGHNDISHFYATSRARNKPIPLLDQSLAHITSLLRKKELPKPKHVPSPPTLTFFLRPDIDNASAPPLNIGHIKPVYQPLPPSSPLTTTIANKRGYHSRTRPRLSKAHNPTPSPPTTPSPTHPNIPPLPPSLHGTRHQLTTLEKLQYASLRARTDTTTLVTAAYNNYTWNSTVEDYLRLMALHDHGWLNSTNITNVSELYNSHSPPHGTPTSFHCFNAYFFPKLYTSTRVFTYTDVSNWCTTDPTRNPRLCDTIYIPVNLTGSHWTGIIVDTTKHHLTYYDSLGDYRGECKRALYYTREWLTAELHHQSLLGTISLQHQQSLGRIEDWTYTHNPGPSPTQTNGFDCGLFYLTTILYHIQGRAPNYHQSHLPHIRQQLTIALLTNHLPSPYTSLSRFDYPLSYVHTTSRTIAYLRQLLTPQTCSPSSDSLPAHRTLILLDDTVDVTPSPQLSLHNPSSLPPHSPHHPFPPTHPPHSHTHPP